jgi:heat shock protein HtpX
MAGFVLLLAVIGGGMDTVFIGNGVSPLPFMTILALGVGSAQAWWGLRHGDVSVLRSSQAQPLEELLSAAATDDDRLRYRQLQNVVEEMAIAAGIPVPKVYVIPDRDPNAFATGPDPAHASIAVTDGLMRTLSREELQGVIAHEMSHIRNLDVRVMTIVAALVGAVALLSDWARRGMAWRGLLPRTVDDRLVGLQLGDPGKRKTGQDGRSQNAATPSHCHAGGSPDSRRTQKCTQYQQNGEVNGIEAVGKLG